MLKTSPALVFSLRTFPVPKRCVVVRILECVGRLAEIYKPLLQLIINRGIPEDLIISYDISPTDMTKVMIFLKGHPDKQMLQDFVTLFKRSYGIRLSISITSRCEMFDRIPEMSWAGFDKHALINIHTHIEAACILSTRRGDRARTEAGVEAEAQAGGDEDTFAIVDFEDEPQQLPLFGFENGRWEKQAHDGNAVSAAGNVSSGARCVYRYTPDTQAYAEAAARNVSNISPRARLIELEDAFAYARSIVAEDGVVRNGIVVICFEKKCELKVAATILMDGRDELMDCISLSEDQNRLLFQRAVERRMTAKISAVAATVTKVSSGRDRAC